MSRLSSYCGPDRPYMLFFFFVILVVESVMVPAFMPVSMFIFIPVSFFMLVSVA